MRDSIRLLSSAMLCLACAGLAACSSDDDPGGAGGQAGAAGAAGAAGGGSGGGAGQAGAANTCVDPDNPLPGSCIEDLLAGCYEPDLSGTCSDEDGTVSWSDGHRYVSSGADAGMYAPGESTPCIAVTVSGSTITAKKGNQTLVYEADSATETGTITCPDGSSFSVKFEQLTQFNRCTGINCPL